MNPSFDAAGLIFFERGWLSSNAVLFASHGSAEAVLVDSGYSSHAAQTVELVRHRLGARRLERIVNTHLHSDHCGGNHALQVAYGCLIDVPAGEAAKVDQWDEEALGYRATGQRCPRFCRTGVLRSGTSIPLGAHAWEVIASPGHDPESVVLHQPELELLISADALWENGFGVVFPELDGEDAFHVVRSTLDRLATLPVSWVLPGHGAPFSGYLQALDRARRRLDRFEADPRLHTRYAAKVLLKFRLLEVQEAPIAELLAWLESTPYLRALHEKDAGQTPFRHWSLELLAELVRTGAAQMEDQVAKNC